MKIAVSTEDGKTICGHLGRCKLFLIYEVKDGQIVSKELREVTPVHGADETHKEHHMHGGHHAEGHHHGSHRGVIDALSDTSAVITNGMGAHFASALESAGINAVITGERDPETAVKAYLEGTLTATGGCWDCGDQ